jgi:hypothetical protein
MAYSSDTARLVAQQLSRFVTINRHQLAGQMANLDFWLDEILHALHVIDGYGSRFERLRGAQSAHVKKYHTTEFSLDDPCCTQGTASVPRRVPDAELREARRALCEASYRFLIRCCNEGFISEPVLREACRKLDIGVEAADIGKRPSSLEFQ